MSLSGELGTVTLADALGLFILDGRSGCVRLHGPQHEGAVWVSGGAVAGASCDLSRALLVRALAASADLTVDQVRGALADPEPARALVTAGGVDPDVVRRAATEQTLDCLALMLGWQEGRFELHLDQAVPDDVGLRLPIATAVATAAARAARWAGLRRALPPDDAVLAVRRDSDTDRVITPDQWQVLARIDGRRTTAQVLSHAGAPLAAATALVELLAAGLVTSGLEPAMQHWSGIAAVIADFERENGALEAELPLPRAPQPTADESPFVAPVLRGRAARRRASHAAAADEQSTFLGASSLPAIGEPRPSQAGLAVEGSAAVQPAQEPTVDGLSRSLLMQLIAGVRGL